MADTDVVLRLVLCKNSEYFKGLLTGGCREAAQVEVGVEIPSALLGVVLKFLYSGDCAASGMNAENATELLGVAAMLQVRELARACEIEIARHVTAENVAEVMAMARDEAHGSSDGFVAWCAGFALGALPAEGAVKALVGLPGGAATLLPLLKDPCALRGLWR